MSVNSTQTSDTATTINNRNEMKFPPITNSALMASHFDLFPVRRRGSSNTSWQSNRSFNFGTITPLNIPLSANNATASSMDQDMVELPQSAQTMNPSSLSTVSSIDTTNYNTQEFVRSAPPYRAVNGWDDAITNFQTPPSDDIGNAMDLDNAMEYDNDSTEAVPEFMKSNFFMPDISRRTSIESMQSLGNPEFPAPQSAPSTFDFMCIQQEIFGNHEWSVMDNSTFSQREPVSLTVSEADIFGSNQTRNRNWSNKTTESENQPIIKLCGMKRYRGISLSNTDVCVPPHQRIKTNTNNSHRGTPVVPIHNIPPMLHHAAITSNITNGVHNMNIYKRTTKTRKRGRPKKSEQKHGGLKKSEREKLRRKELKEGYIALTDLLDLRVARSGAALPDRSVIVSAACDEIKRLEHKLFSISMKQNET